MTNEQKAAYIQSQTACALIESAAMNAENVNRQSLGQSPAYTESDFLKIINNYGIDHNSVISLFHQEY